MPRDVDPGVKDLARIELYSLEDLDAVIKKNRDRKKEEAKKLIPALYKAIDKAAKRGVIKKRTASRKKSRLVKFLGK